MCLQLVSPCSAGEVLQKAGCSLFKVLVLCENTERDTEHLSQAGRASGMEICHGAGPGFPSLASSCWWDNEIFSFSLLFHHFWLNGTFV